MIDFILGVSLALATAYLIFGFIVWAFIIAHGGFMMSDRKTPAPFWRCMISSIIMWPAVLKALEIL